MVPVQTGSGTVSGNMELPRPETKQSRVFGKIPDRDRDCWVWSGPDQVPIGPGLNFPNTMIDWWNIKNTREIERGMDVAKAISSIFYTTYTQTDWDPVWTGPNPPVPVLVWDFPKNMGPLGLRSGQFHIAWDSPRPGLYQDRLNYLSNVFNIIFWIQLLFYKLLTKLLITY